MKTRPSLEDEQAKELLLKYSESYAVGKDNQDENIEPYYVIYVRRSSEDDGHQTQSIPDQLEICKKFAKNNNLKVVAEPIIEEKSAKTADKRVQFNQMIKNLREGKTYNSIIAWHPDRLSRNMKEAGEILDMLDNNHIVDLKFPSYAFNNDAAGKMTLSILFAMAKEFSDKLSEDTKRGVAKKVVQGKYCGSYKRGYYNDSDDYFRPDKNTFDIYVKAWDMYLNGRSYGYISNYLKKNDIDMDTGRMTDFFRDPFFAGFYCYGGRVIDISEVDPEFTPMVSPKDFLRVQKLKDSRTRGWKVSKSFRPFRDLIVCNDCGNYMTPAISTGQHDKYLSVTCSNKKCKNKRRSKKITPIANTIRGYHLIDFTKEFLKKSLKVDKDLYMDLRKSYLRAKSELCNAKKEELKKNKIKITKLKKTMDIIEEKFLSKDISEEYSKKLSNDLSVMLSDINFLNKENRQLEMEYKELEYKIGSDFPEYEMFLNFFKDALTVLQESQDDHLIDQVVKLVFLNLTVGDKKVLSYKLNDPFQSYEKLKTVPGVEDGT